MSDTIKVELPTWKNMTKTHKTWMKEIGEYFAAIGEHRMLDRALAPTEPAPEFPEVTTPEAFIARVTKHPSAVESGSSCIPICASLLRSQTDEQKASLQGYP